MNTHILTLLLTGLLSGSALPQVPELHSQLGLLAGSSAATAKPLTQEGELPWYADIDEARRVAAASGKHVLVSFTGTDWCAWCKKLDAEVLDTPIFAETSLESFVLVRVDFDRAGDARKDLPFTDKNNALKAALGVKAFPTVVLMTAEGIDYVQFPYLRGGAGPYVDKIVEAHTQASFLEEAVPKAVAAIASAKSKEEAAGAADVATQLLLDAGPHALGVPLVPIVTATLKSPDLAREREAKAILALAGANTVDDQLIDRAFAVDPRNEMGLPEAALAASMRTLSGASAVDPLIKRIEAMLSTTIVHDRETAAQMYGDGAYWIKSWQRDSDRSREMASFALRLRPTDPDLLSMLRDLAGQ